MSRSRRFRRARVALATLGALVLAGAAFAAPLSPQDVATLCANAEDQAHCGRLIEASRLARLPGLAVRDGDDLRIALYPAGTTTFHDEVRTSGARTFALWDALDRINGVVLFTTDGDRSGFLLVLRSNGRQIALPAEPVLSPDRQYIVTADFCASGCDNEVALWRVSRDEVRKERVLTSAVPWGEATATWSSPDKLAIEYQRPGDAATSRLDVSLADTRWRPAR